MPDKSKRVQKPYVNLASKGEALDYSDLINPLDFLILEKLPEEGEIAFGLYPQGESTQNLSNTSFKPLTPTQLAMRLRILQTLGLVLKVTMLSRTKEGWQRTTKGKEVYETWKASQK